MKTTPVCWLALVGMLTVVEASVFLYLHAQHTSALGVYLNLHETGPPSKSSTELRDHAGDTTPLAGEHVLLAAH